MTISPYIPLPPAITTLLSMSVSPVVRMSNTSIAARNKNIKTTYCQAFKNKNIIYFTLKKQVFFWGHYKYKNVHLIYK